MRACFLLRTRLFFHMTVIFIVLIMSFSCSKQKKHQTPLQRLVSRTHPTDLKILLVGIDGATFSIINQMIAEGKLPQMNRLMEGGSHGVLKSDWPMESPAIWTSIVTGRNRKAHGINDFIKTTKKGKRVLISSNDRKISALWNWMGPFGKTVGFQGWWASWPAEPVNGWNISDRIIRSRWNEWWNGQKNHGLTFPPDLIEELRPLVVDPAQPPIEEIHELVQLTDEELTEFRAVRKPILGHWLSVFKFAYCAQRTYENFALHMLDKDQSDLTGVFLIANDAICHTFWHFFQPEKFEGVDPKKAQRLGRLIPQFYEHNDHFLAQLLAKVAPDTVVIIVSDHGFQATGSSPEALPKENFKTLQKVELKKESVSIGLSGKHHIDGVLIAYGPPIKKGFSLEAHVFDIAPTILALMGIPVPRDIDGRVLSEMFESAFLSEYPITRINSYENYIDRQKHIVPEDLNQKEIIERLRSLGYVK